MTNSICQFDSVSKDYGKHRVLDNITFHISEGDFVPLLGPNGAGKTTIIKLLLGCQEVTQGTIYLFGNEFDRKALKRVGYSPEHLEFPLSSVQTFLSYMSSLKGLSYSQSRQQISKLTQEFGLESRLKTPISKLSAGMKQKLRIAQALLTDPEFLILDEPTANLDIFARENLLRKVRYLSQEQKITVLFSTHILSDLGNSNDQLVLLKNGKIIYFGQAFHLLELKQGSNFILETSNTTKTIQILDQFKDQLAFFLSSDTNMISLSVNNDSSNPQVFIKQILDELFANNIFLTKFSVSNDVKTAILYKLTEYDK